MNIAIITKYQQKDVNENIINLCKLLSQEHNLFCLPETPCNLLESIPHTIINYVEFHSNNIDVAISIGGDGTMLGLAREIVNFNIPIIGLNQGRLGFITDLKIDDQTIYTLKSMLSGEKIEDHRFLLDCNNQLALNDFVIQRSTSKMLEFDIFINERFAYRCRADGVLISTPTGSTAYNLATGGSIISPDSEVVTITPLLSQNLSNRPLIISNKSVVSLKLISNNAVVMGDGIEMQQLNAGDTISIKKHHTDSIFWHPKYTYNYLETLRNKLGWHRMD